MDLIQQHLHPVMEQLESLGGIYDINTADIHFSTIIDETTKFVPAHKCILASASKKFLHIFYEANENQLLPENWSINTLTPFLRSIYCDTFTIKRDNIAELMQLAEEYDVAECKIACWDFLDHMVQSAAEDIFQVLNISIRFNNQNMQRKCLTKWCDVGHLLLETRAFLSCSLPVLKLILNADFNGRYELNVFLAVIRWAKYQCKNSNLQPDVALNIRYILGDGFQSIRFHRMTAKQFLMCQSLHADIFSADELTSFATKIIRNDESIGEEMNNVPSPIVHLERRFLKSSVIKINDAFASIEMMFGHSKTANVFFAFDSGGADESRWIYAHKCILAIKSPIFKRIFYDKNGKTSNHPITDAPYDDFLTFIHLFYRQTIDGLVTMDNANRIIMLANSYEATEITEQCIRFAIKSICFENIFRVLDMCFLYSNSDSVCSCLEWIVTNEKEMHLAFHVDCLVGCSHKTVKFALSINVPNRNEIDIFKASFEWAKKCCEHSQVEPTPAYMRMALGDAFNLIRMIEIDTDEMKRFAPDFSF